MNVLLIFFALPVATIIISIALQKVLKSPPLVAAIIFSIFLIVTFVINNINFLVATIIYTIISFITAIVVCFICRILRKINEYNCNCKCNNNNDNKSELLKINSRCGNLENGNLLTISSNCCNGVNNDLLTISSNNTNENCNSENNCNNISSTNGVTAKINVIPNNSDNGRTGCVCGRYRRRC